ncbi:hypothetical protein [Mycolicibacterium goodii]|uniref:Uncharacterized protein n=1 Tax=Mycolicibacterium goodii TaxID=134601 RepID=A0A0K0XD03_MYCGD|nr:hypothetical protein AFA91_29175 [Mycolicibacterium goodii]
MISNFYVSEVAMAGMPKTIPSVVSVAHPSAVMPAHLPPFTHAAHAVAAGWPVTAAISLQPKRRRTAAAATRASVDWSPT